MKGLSYPKTSYDLFVIYYHIDTQFKVSVWLLVRSQNDKMKNVLDPIYIF